MTPRLRTGASEVTAGEEESLNRCRPIEALKGQGFSLFWSDKPIMMNSVLLRCNKGRLRHFVNVISLIDV